MNEILEKKHKISAGECAARLTSVDDALYVISGKWKLRIIIALQEHQSVRFNELQRSIPGISARVLSNELKDLELNGFVKRVVHPDEIPVVVEYIPTDYSKTLRNVITSLAEWGTMHRQKIIAES